MEVPPDYVKPQVPSPTILRDRPKARPDPPTRRPTDDRPTRPDPRRDLRPGLRSSPRFRRLAWVSVRPRGRPQLPFTELPTVEHTVFEVPAVRLGLSLYKTEDEEIYPPRPTQCTAVPGTFTQDMARNTGSIWCRGGTWNPTLTFVKS